ncbi:hypothetical protein AVEN_136421-1, partial [Araneus ventricosus]
MPTLAPCSGPKGRIVGQERSLFPWVMPLVEARNETQNPLRGDFEFMREVWVVYEKEYGWQKFGDFEPCLKANFGTSVNALPNFRLIWV